MNVKAIRMAGTLIISVILFTGCTPDSEKNLQAGIEAYKNGFLKKARQFLEDGLVLSARVSETERNWRCGCSGNAIYRCGEKLQFLTAHDRDIQCPNVVEDVAIHSQPLQAAVTDRDSIFIYHDGELVKTVEHDDDILAITLKTGSVFFYSAKKLHRYTLEEDSSSLVVEASFSPPSDLKEYRSCLHLHGNRLILTVGIAGIYNISVINLKTGDITIHNQRVATWKIHTVDDGIFVVSGSSGSWTLKKISYSGKTMETIHSFSSLHDIFLMDGMYLVNTPDGIMFSNYEKSLHFFPFTFGLQCATPDYLFIRTAKSQYLLDAKEMKKVLTRLRKETPELFEEKD